MSHSTTIPHETLPHGNAPQAAVTPLDTPRPWLEHFPPSRRSGIANWFHSAVRAGHHTPRAAVQQVLATAHQRLRWARTNEEDVHLRHVLACLDTDHQNALAYAETVLAWEALPRHERERQKAARATHYQRQYMAQFPATPKQVSFLRARGYTGALPANRTEASSLIDTLLHPRQEAHHG